MTSKFLKWLFKVLSGAFLTLLMLFFVMWISSYLDNLGYRYNWKLIKFLAILAVSPLIGSLGMVKICF